MASTVLRVGTSLSKIAALKNVQDADEVCLLDTQCLAKIPLPESGIQADKNHGAELCRAKIKRPHGFVKALCRGKTRHAERESNTVFKKAKIENREYVFHRPQLFGGVIRRSAFLHSLLRILENAGLRDEKFIPLIRPNPGVFALDIDRPSTSYR